MSRRDEDNTPQFFIGPETYSDPGALMDDARQRVRDEDDRNKESSRLARRLLIAFILIVLLGVGFYIVLPYYGLRLPPFVPILCFGAIAVGALLNTGETPYERSSHNDEQGCTGEGGCAVGMCPGPRPLRMFKDDRKKKS
jgi:hypothetical protein